MRVDQLKGLIAVKNTGSINKAAQSLYISYQSLLASLNSFEEELGYKILNRTAQGVALTDVGKKIVHDSEKIVEIVDSWFLPEFYIKNSSPEIKIMCTALMRDVLDSIILEMRQQYPNIKFKLNKMISNSELILSRDLKNDIFLFAVSEQKEKYFFEVKQNQFDFEILGKDSWKVIMNKNNPLSNMKGLSKEQLLSCKWAVYADNDAFFKDNNELSQFLSDQTLYCSDEKKQIVDMVANSKDIVSFGVSLDAFKNVLFKNGTLILQTIASDVVKEKVVYLLGISKKNLSLEEKMFIKKIREFFSAINDQGLIH